MEATTQEIIEKFDVSYLEEDVPINKNDTIDGFLETPPDKFEEFLWEQRRLFEEIVKGQRTIYDLQRQIQIELDDIIGNKAKLEELYTNYLKDNDARSTT